MTETPIEGVLADGLAASPTVSVTDFVAAVCRHHCHGGTYPSHVMAAPSQVRRWGGEARAMASWSRKAEEIHGLTIMGVKVIEAHGPTRLIWTEELRRD